MNDTNVQNHVESRRRQVTATRDGNKLGVRHAVETMLVDHSVFVSLLASSECHRFVCLIVINVYVTYCSTVVL